MVPVQSVLLCPSNGAASVNDISGVVAYMCNCREIMARILGYARFKYKWIKGELIGL